MKTVHILLNNKSSIKNIGLMTSNKFIIILFKKCVRSTKPSALRPNSPFNVQQAQTKEAATTTASITTALATKTKNNRRESKDRSSNISDNE